MPRIAYTSRRFNQSSRNTIEQAESICREYAAQGYSLTLRQIFYQFVSRDLLPNRQSEYKRLGNILSEARLAGYLDWNYLEDRTRNLRSLSHWDSPEAIISSAAYSYRRDKWEDQPAYVEVWIEKDALAGVIEGPCNEWDVPYFSCRGYTSQSEVWRAGLRLSAQLNRGKFVKVIHLGDHDPSGIDMTRDIESRIVMFTGHHASEGVLQIDRIALNMDQIETYNPPPNPAKLSDSRATAYIARYGRESWELDALNPTVIGDLIRDTVRAEIDWDLWNAAVAREADEQQQLADVEDNWTDVVAFLETL